MPSKNNKTTQSSKSKIQVFSFDFDGCLFNSHYHLAADRQIIRHNQAFLDQLKRTGEGYSARYAFIGSNRQDYQIDRLNAIHNRTGSCFPAFNQVCQYIGVQQHSFLMADLHHGLPHGRAFDLIQNEHPDASQYAWLFDETKMTILYAQLQKMANENPNDQIDFFFFDDREDILRSLQSFFMTFPDFISHNVNLFLNGYRGNQPVQIDDVIRGQGMIDRNYEETVRCMGREALVTQYGTKQQETDRSIDAARVLSPRLHLNPLLLPRKALPPVLNPLDKSINKTEPLKLLPLKVARIIGKEELSYQLKLMRDEADVLSSKGNPKAASVARRLYFHLQAWTNQLLKHQITEDTFKRLCSGEIEKARPELEKMGWREILGNVLLAILGVGVVYLAACITNKVTTGHFLFFRPEAAVMLDGIENKLMQVQVA